MKRRALSVILVLFALGGFHAFGQDQSGQDIFDTSAFDQNVQESKQQEQTAKLEYLFGGSFLSDNYLYTSMDFAGYALGGRFSGKAFTKVTVPDYGILYLGYNFSHNVYQGIGGTAPGGAGSFLSLSAGDLYGTTFSLSEFHISFDMARTVFVRVGNQLIAWGPSVIWTPVDFINLQRVNPLSSLDLRVGKPGLRIHVPLGTSNVFLFGDFSGMVTPAGVVQDPLKATNAAARWDITLLGYELALTGFWGASNQNYGFDFSGRALGFDVYGELAAALPYDASSLTFASSIGFQRALGELSYWSIQGEFFYNDAGTTDASTYPAMITARTFIPFYVGKFYAYAGVTRSHLFIDGVSASLSGFGNFSDSSFLLRLSTTIDLPKLVPFTFAVSYAGGGANREFTYFVGNNSLSADLQVRFSF
jgi:hypothetical protein